MRLKSLDTLTKCRLINRAKVKTRSFVDQFFISEATASERSSRFHEPISISPFAGIESKGLFIQVTEKMKRLDRNVSAFDRPFQQRPKVFNALSVNLTVNVLFSVI